MEKPRIHPDHGHCGGAPCASELRVNLAGMLRRALVFATVLSLGCTSDEFDVAGDNDAASNETGGNDSGTTTDDSGGTETAPGPCDPEEGKAKYCIEVKLASSVHPPYTTASGAAGLGIDGSGKVVLVLWDRDPASAAPGEKVPPKHALPYPPESSGMINVDKDFPVTIPGSAEPGTYTIAALFADNLAASRPDGEVLAGDFVVLPNIVGGKAVFPKMTLELGKVQKMTLEVRPNRRVSVTLGLDPGFATYAKTVPSIHGDGPTFLGIFDGVATDFSGYLHSGFSRCVNTKIQETVTNSPIIEFTTTVEGEHNLYMALFDYTSDPWPGKGTITSTPTAPYPRVNLKPELWTASAVVDLVKIPLGPYGTAPTDTLTCP